MKLMELHLNYGFSDVDWGIISAYIIQKPEPLFKAIANLTEKEKIAEVYISQVYYAGLQHDFFDLDFRKFHYTTHIFRILAILSCFLLFKIISGNMLIAAFSTIVYAYNYTAVGSMYTVASSVDYLAIFSMNIFFYVYWKATKNKKLVFYLFSCLLFLLTLSLSIIRMYPLIILLAVIELFRFFNKYESFSAIARRLIIVYSPFLVVFMLKPFIFLNFFFGLSKEILANLNQGNWNILLTPLIALGSILLPQSYNSYINPPIFTILFLTILTGMFIPNHPVRFIIRMLIFNLIFNLLIFILGDHFTNHFITPGSINYAIFGGFILSFSLSSFIQWLTFKEKILIPLFIGPALSFFYILLTWISAHPSEVFSGVHRYLTVPAIGMSLFFGSIIFLASQKLYSLSKHIKFLTIFTVLPFLLLIPYIQSNTKDIQYFFNSQLSQGFGAEDKNIMRNQLLSLLTNLSNTNRSFFYFDFTGDNDNSYYYDNTILGGLGTWMLWDKRINFNEEITPKSLWNNFQLLKSFVYEKDGKKGFLYHDDQTPNHFIELKDFYAFKLKEKKVIDIKQEILKELGIN